MPSASKSTAASKRPSRQSGPAAATGAKKATSSSRSRQASRSKSASPTRSRSASKTRTPAASAASSKTKAKPEKQPKKQTPKPRSRSSSRSRASTTSANKKKSSSPAKKASPSPPPKRKSTPAASAATARKSRPATPSRAAAAAAINHNLSLSPSPTRRGATTTTTATATLTSTATVSMKSTAAGREFGGAIGATLLTCCLPLCLIWLSLLSDGVATFGRTNRRLFGLPRGLQLADLFSLRASLIYAGWLAAQLVLYCLPVGGKWVQHEGGWYHCNGLFALLASVSGLQFAHWWGLPVGQVICAELTRLTVCSCVFSALLSMGLLARSYRMPARALTPEAAGAARAGGLASAIYGYFMGRELHPRLGRFDLKFFLEMRPGLIGWVVLDMAYLYQYKQLGGAANLPFFCLALMHAWYVFDALLFESAILTTTDIKREGLGFMLAFGNLAWVPFFYSLSARQLIKQPVHMPTYCLAGVVLLNLFGYVLFRFSNRQKDLFRQCPDHPSFTGCRTVPTGLRNRHLLADGFWGRLRHPNFVGDLIMACAWSLAAGLHSPLAWLYPAYLLVLLLHRARRDEIHCSAKYGVAWQRYCQLVPCRFIPRVY